MIVLWGWLLINPVAISVDREGYIYVCDASKGKILVYNPNGKFHKSIKLKAGQIADMHFNEANN